MNKRSIQIQKTLFCGIGGTPNLITANGQQNVMSNEWFARPVLFVADIQRSVDFYVKQLGFTQAWRI
jgi:hypothetical protein